MRRFFIEKPGSNEKSVLLAGKELHHLKDVLRLKKGDKVIVFDGKGREFAGNIEIIGKDDALIAIEKQLEVVRESPIEIVLAQGIVKPEKMEMIIQKATELGVSRIIPFVASRVVSKPVTMRSANKIQRWQNIAIEAAKQCGRNVIPKIEELKTFSEVLRVGDKYGKIIPWEGVLTQSMGTRNNLKDVLKSKFIGCVVLIGPEGGFSDDEIAEAKRAGFLTVTLGPRILRAETAAISVAAIIQYELGDMGS
ncbi:MAG: 16S rRNA (uracil(1498)-N(3))-methyltransferase [Deltaproteobacteria bacterium]|nr:16S rRNA (uracil(1498)-N(3))-methyltransferase [Deltaproteobacteria bacterium]